MGEINLIPGQQVRGQKRSGQKTAGGVEYTQPREEKIPVPAKPPKESWWHKRQARRAAKQAQRAAQAAYRAAQAKVQPVPVATTTKPPVRPLAVDVNLLPHAPAAVPAPKPRPIPQAEPDFLSDAGFKSNSFPPSEAYSIRRPKRQTRHEPVGEPAELLDVNLIPKEFGLTERPKHSYFELLWYGLTAALMVGAVYGGLQGWQFNLTQKSSELQQQVALLEGQISAYDTERQTADELQTQLQGLQAVMTQHVTYDEFFSFLERNTLPSVYYKSINVDSRTGQVTASAVTADFEQLRAQEAVFQAHPMVKDVTVTSATRTVPTTPTTEDETAVDSGSHPLLFNLSLSLDTSLFHP